MSSFGKNYFFTLENAKTLKKFELYVDQMFLVLLCRADTMRSAADTMRSAANTMRGAADTWCMLGVVGKPESVSHPPYMAKNNIF